jgi:hypothetical protein
MRLLKLRVNIAPDTDEELRKMINIINGPSRLYLVLQLPYNVKLVCTYSLVSPVAKKF